MAACNRTRVVDELLERTKAQPPSFTIHFYPEHWVLNNGSKFLYHNQTACILDDIRAHRIPVDFLDLFDAAKVPFYDGCMIVELLDYRPQRKAESAPDKPERTRVVLHPNSESLWADICSLNQKHGSKWTDMDALEIESKILLATAPPLCLAPDPNLTRIANHILRVSTPPVPKSLKRKAVVLEPEEDELEKTRRAKIMAFGNPTRPKLHNPNYRLLEHMQKRQKTMTQGPTPPVQLSGHQYLNQPNPNHPAPVAATPNPPQPNSASPAVVAPDNPTPTPQPSNTATPQAPYTTTAYAQANGTHTSMSPQPPANGFIHPVNPAPTSAPSPMQPQIYTNVQAATDVANRSATPAQVTPANQARPPQHPYAHLQQTHIPTQAQPSPRLHPMQTIPQQSNVVPQIPQQIPQHLQPPQRPPSQPQPPRPSQTPVPSHQQFSPQAVPSPIPRHSPSLSQHQPSQPIPVPVQHTSPQAQQQHLQPPQQTPRLSHQATPRQLPATIPQQYSQSPKPAPQTTAQTPQPSQVQPNIQKHPQLVPPGYQGQVPPAMLARLNAASAAAASQQQQQQPGVAVNNAQIQQFYAQQYQQRLMAVRAGTPGVTNQVPNQMNSNAGVTANVAAVAAGAGIGGQRNPMMMAQGARTLQQYTPAQQAQIMHQIQAMRVAAAQQQHAQQQQTQQQQSQMQAAQGQVQVQSPQQQPNVVPIQAQQGQGQSQGQGQGQGQSQITKAQQLQQQQQYYLQQIQFNPQNMQTYGWSMGRGMGMINGQNPNSNNQGVGQVQGQGQGQGVNGMSQVQQQQQQQQMAAALAAGKGVGPGQLPNR